MLSLLVKNFEELEHNPRSQFSVNKWLGLFWLCNMPVVLILEFIFPHWWLAISATYIAEGTIWGIVATHFGAMSSALAAMGTRKQQEKSLKTEPAIIRPESKVVVGPGATVLGEKV